MKEGTARPEVVVDLTGLPELRGATEDADGLTLGALTPIAGIAHEAFPLIAEVIAQVGGMAHRTATTLGGNLLSALRCFAFNQSVDSRAALGACLRTGGDVCHAAPGGVCVATHQTDLAPALLVLDAEVVIEGTKGIRTLSLYDLHRGEAEKPFRLRTGEILTAIRLPWPAGERRASYRKLRLRKSIDRPILGIAAVGPSPVGEGPRRGPAPRGHRCGSETRDHRDPRHGHWPTRPPAVPQPSSTRPRPSERASGGAGR